MRGHDFAIYCCPAAPPAGILPSFSPRPFPGGEGQGEGVLRFCPQPPPLSRSSRNLAVGNRKSFDRRFFLRMKFGRNTLPSAGSFNRVIQIKAADSAALQDLVERGEQILLACQANALIESSRSRSGIPPSEPVPWPESTRQFLKQCWRNAARSR